MPKEHEVTESEEYSGKFVRVRGRLSRKGKVRWSPCLRTEKGSVDLPAERRSTAAVAKATHWIDLLDYRGESLESAPVQPHFFARDQDWATFVARLPYRNNVQSVRLRRGERTLGTLDNQPIGHTSRC
jgi:hypothetical protein